MKGNTDTCPNNTIKEHEPKVEKVTETTPEKIASLYKKRRIMIPATVLIILAAVGICLRQDLAYAFPNGDLTATIIPAQKAYLKALAISMIRRRI
jgi:hypothetical protein